ncbi:helix-turn-helix domain-containing protein [Cohnella sp.]|uniref:helix-turn-helix domain-containing protein n=1 Tax=Cohnella sp. TaxID=1883426 RepID=UPI003562D4E0
MKARQRIIRYSVYRQMFLTFVLLTAVVIAVACGVLYALFSVSTAKEVGRIAESTLRQNSFVSVVIRDQIRNLGDELLNDSDIIRTMYGKDQDRLQEYRAYSRLRSIQTTFPYVQFIGLYNGFTKQYTNTLGLTAKDEAELIGAIESGNRLYFDFFPRRVSDPLRSKASRNVLTFVLTPGAYPSLPSKSMIVINIDEDYVQRLIGGYKSGNADNLYVINDNGTVMTHTDPSQFMDNLSDLPYVRSILNANADSGYFTTPIDGKKHIVSYVKSDSMKWVFISTSRYDSLLRNMSQLRQWTLFIALTIFALCFVASVWLTNRTFNPLRNLLDKMTAPQQSKRGPGNLNEFELIDSTFSAITERLSVMESALSVARRADLLRYMKGSQVDMLHKFPVSWASSRFSVVLLEIDGLKEMQLKHSAKTQSAIQYAICNVAQEVLESHAQIKIVIVEEGEIGLLLQLDEPNLPLSLIGLLMEIQSHIRKYFWISLTVGIGRVVSSPEEIRLSYQSAKACTALRFFRGGGQIFEYGDAEDKPEEDSQYPQVEEKRLLEAIRAGNSRKAADELEQFVGRLDSGGDYHQSLFHLHQLVTGLYRQFATGSRKEAAHTEMLLEFMKGLPAYETLEGIAEALRDIVNRLCEQPEEATQLQHQELIDSVCDRVYRNYPNPDLSLERMAGEVNLSRGYLGKLFKSYKGVSFNDFLNGVRIEEAAKLLQETELPIQTISEKVGIFNTTYFYTLFKKRYRLSPAQFRSRTDEYPNLKSED